MKKTNFLKLLGLSMGVLTVSAYATVQEDPYFQIKNVEVTEVIETELPADVQDQLARAGHPAFVYPTTDANNGTATNPGAPLKPGTQPTLPGIFDQPKPPTTASGEISLSEIVNTLQKVWDFITKNRPVVNLNMASANALPKGAGDWNVLGEWQMPKSKRFHIAYKNGFNSDVVGFDYRIIYTTGGNYKGVGKYIANISSLAAELNVGWGYTFNAQTLVPNVVNVGTEAAPIAGAETSIKWEVITPVKHHVMTESYFVRGDGQFVNINE